MALIGQFSSVRDVESFPCLCLKGRPLMSRASLGWFDIARGVISEGLVMRTDRSGPSRSRGLYRLHPHRTAESIHRRSPAGRGSQGGPSPVISPPHSALHAMHGVTRPAAGFRSECYATEGKSQWMTACGEAEVLEADQNMLPQPCLPPRRSLIGELMHHDRWAAARVAELRERCQASTTAGACFETARLSYHPAGLSQVQETPSWRSLLLLAWSGGLVVNGVCGETRPRRGPFPLGSATHWLYPGCPLNGVVNAMVWEEDA